MGGGNSSNDGNNGNDGNYGNDEDDDNNDNYLGWVMIIINNWWYIFPSSSGEWAQSSWWQDFIVGYFSLKVPSPQMSQNVSTWFLWTFFCISELFCCALWTSAPSGWSVVVSTMDSPSGGEHDDDCRNENDYEYGIIHKWYWWIPLKWLWNFSARQTLGETLTTTTSYLQQWKSQVGREMLLGNKQSL